MLTIYEELDPINYKSPQLQSQWCWASVCITLKAGPQMAFSKGCFLGFCVNSAMRSISEHYYGRCGPYFSGLKHRRVKLHTCSSSKNDEFCCIYIHLRIRSTFSVVTFLKNLEPSSHLLFLFCIIPASKPVELRSFIRSCKCIDGWSWSLSAGPWITRISASIEIVFNQLSKLQCSGAHWKVTSLFS